MSGTPADPFLHGSAASEVNLLMQQLRNGDALDALDALISSPPTAQVSRDEGSTNSTSPGMGPSLSLVVFLLSHLFCWVLGLRGCPDVLLSQFKTKWSLVTFRIMFVNLSNRCFPFSSFHSEHCLGHLLCDNITRTHQNESLVPSSDSIFISTQRPWDTTCTKQEH